MIINKSGITIRLKIANIRVMGRATQGVRLINLEKRNDEIASVCKVMSEQIEEIVEETIEEISETEIVTNSEISEEDSKEIAEDVSENTTEE
jgi:DNA gyrase subunit A